MLIWCHCFMDNLTHQTNSSIKFCLLYTFTFLETFYSLKAALELNLWVCVYTLNDKEPWAATRAEPNQTEPS